MLIEFHVTADKLKAVLLGRIRQQQVCVTQEFEALGELHVLDHVEFLDSGTFERLATKATIHVPNAPDPEINATLVRYIQPVMLAVTKISTLEANNDQASPPDKSPTIDLLFNLSMSVTGGVPQFRVQLADVDAGILEAVAPGTAQLIKNSVSVDIKNDMDLSAIGTLLETTVTATNAGMVVDVSGSRVTMRIEVNGTGNSQSAWQAFFNNAVPDLLSGKEWSLLVDKGLIVPVVVSHVGDGLGDAGDFALESGPSGSWSFATGPRVNVSFSGEVIDACTCLFWDIDVDVDVDMRVRLSVPQDNVLRMKATMEWDLNDAEVFCCALTGALFWPVIGSIMLANEKIGWLEFLGGLALGPLAVFIGVIAQASSQTPDFAPTGSCQKLSDTEVQCDEPVSISAGLGVLTLTGISGLADGPLLSGTLFSGPAFGVAVLQTQVFPFAWGIHGSCNRGFHPGNQAEILLTNTGSAPITVCEVKVVDDPLGVYSADLTHDPQNPSWVVGSIVIVPDMTDAFLQDKYPCKLMIKSSGGARFITLDPPSPASDAEMQQLEMNAILSKIKCYRAADPFWAATGRMNPKWLVDPPPDDVVQVEHLWDIFVAGLRPGEQVLVQDHGGVTVAQGAADSRGLTRVSAIVAPARDGADIAIARLGAGGIAGGGGDGIASGGAPAPAAGPTHAITPTVAKAETAVDESRRVLIKQGTLIRRATLPTYARCGRIAAGRLNGAPSIVAVADDGVRVFDVRRTAAPSLSQSIRAAHLRGAALCGDRLLVWSADGVASFAAGESQVGFTPARRYAQIVDAIKIGNSLAVLTDDGVELLTAELTSAGRIAARGSYLDVSGKQLAVGDAHGVRLFDLPMSGTARRTRRYAEGRGAATEPRADVAGPDAPVIAAADRRGAADRLDTSAPWRARAARVGRVIARVDPGGRSIGIYDLARAYDC
jgi:hypothetical protein